jgi:hypothetical protein
MDCFADSLETDRKEDHKGFALRPINSLQLGQPEDFVETIKYEPMTALGF